VLLSLLLLGDKWKMLKLCSKSVMDVDDEELTVPSLTFLRKGILLLKKVNTQIHSLSFVVAGWQHPWLYQCISGGCLLCVGGYGMLINNNKVK